MTHNLTIDSVRLELEPLDLSINRVSGGNYRVAPIYGTPDEREMKAQYVDTLGGALRIGHQFAELRDVSKPASLPCGVTVEDARSLSSDGWAKEQQLRNFVDKIATLCIWDVSEETCARELKNLQREAQSLRGDMQPPPPMAAEAPDVAPTQPKAESPRRSEAPKITGLESVLGALSCADALSLLVDERIRKWLESTKD
jgi:hypothetical protein